MSEAEVGRGPDDEETPADELAAALEDGAAALESGTGSEEGGSVLDPGGDDDAREVAPADDAADDASGRPEETVAPLLAPPPVPGCPQVPSSTHTLPGSQSASAAQ